MLKVSARTILEWRIKEPHKQYMVTDSAEKAEILSKQFKSVFTAEDISTIPDKGTSSYPSITDIDVTLNGMRNLLLKFDLNKSTGPDNIHATFLNHAHCF